MTDNTLLSFPDAPLLTLARVASITNALNGKNFFYSHDVVETFPTEFRFVIAALTFFARGCRENNPGLGETLTVTFTDLSWKGTALGNWRVDITAGSQGSLNPTLASPFDGETDRAWASQAINSVPWAFCVPSADFLSQKEPSVIGNKPLSETASGAMTLASCLAKEGRDSFDIEARFVIADVHETGTFRVSARRVS